MSKISDLLNGAWEERGVFGTRIEINGSRIVIYWRSSPVLKTTFKTVEKENGYELKLRDDGLRNNLTGPAYATVSELLFSDDRLTFTEDFPISGKSVSNFTKTDNNLYGNCVISDDLLKKLHGTWKTDDGYHELVFKRNTMSFTGKTVKIHALIFSGQNSEFFTIANEDPSIRDWEGFTQFQYKNGVISTSMIVLDAPSWPELIFKKIN